MGENFFRDTDAIKDLFYEMYGAMINKDKETLEKVHDDSFVLTHMTGMRQNKEEYIKAIMDGTLNYYSEKTVYLDAHSQADEARMHAESIVDAAVFGGNRNTWRLQLDFLLNKKDGCWKITEAKASTF